MTTAVILASVITISITAPQQAEAAKKAKYCFTYFDKNDPGAGTLDRCSTNREGCESSRQELLAADAITDEWDNISTCDRIKNNK